jgi:transposase-like protein
MGEQQQRWTAKRKAEIILQILRQTTTVVDVARQYDLTPSEVQDWIDTFLKAGEQGLKARASNVQEQTDKEIKELKAAIGDLYVENTILKKAKALWGFASESSRSEETES